MRQLSGLTVLCLDRATKWWALTACKTPWVLTSWCHGRLAFNTGVAWSLGESLPNAVMCTSMLIALFGIGYMSYRAQGLSYGALLIVGGALSNFLDRLIYSGV